ncbi:MAG: transglutaminase-like domain-containing protein [Ardenticatenaceae bacterium]|nr:transglutaminase-like domain-containing protein [Ardenticatenaceae bacterium]
MSSSRSELAPSLLEPALALAMLAPLVPLANRWSLNGPQDGMPVAVLGSLIGLLLARRGPGALAAALVVALALTWAELGHLWPPLSLLRADLVTLLAGEWPAGATWHWLTPAVVRWLAILESDRGVLAAFGWHCLLVSITAVTLWRLRHTPDVSAWPLLVVPLIWLSADTYLTDERVVGLLGTLAAGVSLAVARHVLARERRWEQAGFAYSDEISREVLAVGVITVVAVITLAWLSPGLMDLELARPLYTVLNLPWRVANELSGGRLQELSRRPGPADIGVAATVPAHRLSGPRVVSDELLFQVTLPDEPPALPLRWRTWTLDHYDGHRWSAAPPRVERSTATWSVQPPPPAARPRPSAVRPGRAWSLAGRGWPACGRRADLDRRCGGCLPRRRWRSRRAARRAQPLHGGLGSDTTRDVAVGRLSGRHGSSSGDTTARATARAPVGWLRPAPRGNGGLARASAAPAPLRDQHPRPAPDRDAVDWFLFEEGRGYCDYFASAFVVLGRAVGLPARIVIGFAPGTFDPTTRTYFVTGEVAHTWAEVWFDGRGWVEFDPTPAAYTRLRVRTGPVPAARLQPVRLLPLVGLFVIALAAAAVVLLWRAGLRWGRPTPTDALGAWAALQERVTRLGVPPSPTATPTEQAAALAAALQACVVTLRLGQRCLVVRPPDISAPLTAAAAAYARARYGPLAPAPALPGWHRLLRPLWWLLLHRSTRADRPRDADSGPNR